MALSILLIYSRTADSRFHPVKHNQFDTAIKYLFASIYWYIAVRKGGKGFYIYRVSRKCTAICGPHDSRWGKTSKMFLYIFIWVHLAQEKTNNQNHSTWDTRKGKKSYFLKKTNEKNVPEHFRLRFPCNKKIYFLFQKIKK